MDSKYSSIGNSSMSNSFNFNGKRKNNFNGHGNGNGNGYYNGNKHNSPKKMKSSDSGINSRGSSFSQQSNGSGHNTNHNNSFKNGVNKSLQELRSELPVALIRPRLDFYLLSIKI